MNATKNEIKRPTKKKKREGVQKVKCARGLIFNNNNWLTQSSFAMDEAKVESVGKYRDSVGHNYLSIIEKKCWFCGVFRFESKSQG